LVMGWEHRFDYRDWVKDTWGRSWIQDVFPWLTL
jgi:hypothetical protein